MQPGRVVGETFEVPASGGIVLATDVLRPDDRRRRPCLVQRVPYGRLNPAIVNGALNVQRAVAEGFVVVTQDCRGRGQSTGTFVPFVDEERDAVATLDWIQQQFWSDGTVGMFGRSYASINQWLAAESRHDALRAIAPTLSGADPRDWIRPSGVLESGFVLWWAIRYLAPEILERAPGAHETEANVLAGLIADPAAFLSGEADHSGLYDLLPFLPGWLEESVPRVGVSLPSRCQIPVFATAGWFDIFARGTLSSFASLADNPASRLVIGPWAHGGGFSGVYPDWTAGPRGSDTAIGLATQQFSWFRACLSGDADPGGPPVQAFQCGDNIWMEQETWPLPGERERCFGVDSDLDGTLRLVEQERRSSAADSVLIPRSALGPVPTRGGQSFLPGMEVAALAGPRCQGDLLDRPDLVTIVGEIIDEPLRVTGDVNLRVTAVSAGPGMGSERDGLLCVRLADQAPDGKTVVILEAAAPVPARHGRHHLSVRLGPIGWTFEPGHAPLLVFSRTSVPRFEAPHPNSPERLLIEIDEGLILTLPTAPLGEPA